MKKIIEWTQENIFMKSITWDTFTWFGKLTLYPIILILGWIMIICFIPFIPIMFLLEKIHFSDLLFKLKRKWDLLFIRSENL